MLRVKVYEVDENGAEKPYLDDKGNPVVKEGAGLVMAIQTAEKVDGGIKADGNVCIIGEINPLTMGTLLNEHGVINKWMTKATMHKVLCELMHEEEKKEE